MSGTTILFVLLEGFLAFVSPCILPMLPVYFLYLSGESIVPEGDYKQGIPETKGSLTESNERKPARKPRSRRLIINTMFFILGFTLVFLLLGATSTAIGQVFNSNRVLLERISGAVIILLGIHMTGLIKIPLLNQDHRLNFGKRKVGLISALFLGIAFSLGWSPCLGPFLGSALLLSGQSSTLWEGMALLLVFSLGLAIPFLLASILFEELTAVFTWFKKHMKLVRIVSGSLLVILGILMLAGWFGYYAGLFT